MTTRRVFLRDSAMAMVSLGFAPPFLARAAAASAERRKLLVAVFQRGAVDGLNTVVPYGDAEYYRARSTIAISRPGRSDGAINLDGFFGLHPRLAPLQPLWADRRLAIVHACGSPDQTRSHFDAQDYMEAATPGVKSTRDGWLNRCLRADGASQAASPLRAVALTTVMPRSLAGAAPALAMGSTAGFDVRDARARASFESAYAAAGDAALHGAAAGAIEAMKTLRAKTTGPYQPANGATYPRSPFGQALQEIARLAKADVGLEIAFAESTNWDHHINEGGASGQLASRLDDFARGLAALTTDMGERMADTLVVTMSEFGRAVAQNGSGGTDHGHGNAMLLIGGGVKGGQVYGKWPGLSAADRFEGRDLAVTTDFRDIFAEVASKHLGASAGALAGIFPGYPVKATAFRGVLRG